MMPHIYVVVGHTGTYSDHQAWLVAAHPSEDAALTHARAAYAWHVAHGNAAARVIEDAFLDGTADRMASDEPTPMCPSPNPHDNRYRCRYADETHYEVETVEYFP